MAVTLHRCPATFLKTNRHACWRVERALQDAGVEYELATRWGLPRSRRADLIEATGQTLMPAIRFEDGTWYREESSKMAARITAGQLFGGEQASGGDPVAASASAAASGETDA